MLISPCFYIAYICFRLLKYEIMLVLNRDQYYSVTLCEEKSSIQVDIMLRKYMRKSCENRKRLIDFFQVKLQQFCYELKPASSLPIVCIQCPHCDKLHLKLINALEGRTLLCNMIHIPPHYYQDLFREFQDTRLPLSYSVLYCNYSYYHSYSF